MRLVAAVLSEFSDHSDHSDQPKLPAVPRLRSLTLKAFHLEEGNATNLIIALNSIVSRASQVATSTNLGISWKWGYSSSPKDSSQKKKVVWVKTVKTNHQPGGRILWVPNSIPTAPPKWQPWRYHRIPTFRITLPTRLLSHVIPWAKSNIWRMIAGWFNLLPLTQRAQIYGCSSPNLVS